MTKQTDYNINVERYNGPVKPKMPIHAANKIVTSSEAAIVSTRAQDMDFLFL